MGKEKQFFNVQMQGQRVEAKTAPLWRFSVR